MQTRFPKRWSLIVVGAVRETRNDHGRPHARPPLLVRQNDRSLEGLARIVHVSIDVSDDGALKAIPAAAAPGDQLLGRDVEGNGALRLETSPGDALELR